MDNGAEILEEYHRDNEAFIRKYGRKPEETIPDDAPHDCVYETLEYIRELRQHYDVPYMRSMKCPKCNNMVYFDKVYNPKMPFPLCEYRVVQAGNSKSIEVTKTNQK
jgi:hypothetical protein